MTPQQYELEINELEMQLSRDEAARILTKDERANMCRRLARLKLAHAEARAAQREMAATDSCPECGHVFQGKRWEGIDAHWRAKHEHIMPYEKAWPLIRAGTYRRKCMTENRLVVVFELLDLLQRRIGNDCHVTLGLRQRGTGPNFNLHLRVTWMDGDRIIEFNRIFPRLLLRQVDDMTPIITDVVKQAKHTYRVETTPPAG